MARLIQKEKWVPRGVAELEKAAMAVVRSTENALVIAGPGAGKTELLAQRACYLLETGLCPHPKRILAISFKRDAAKNLSDRVAKRVGPDLAKRFDSMTFDAFAKSLVDRFRLGIPSFFRPKADYILDFDLKKTNESYLRGIMEEVVGDANHLTLEAINEQDPKRIYRDFIIGTPLAFPLRTGNSFEQSLALYIWKLLLRKRSKSVLNFEMLGRLADLMIRHNPSVLNALRVTYAYVFLDEFQDTSGIHYDLTKTAFRGSQAVLTAVGDEKQRIMVWAGALEGVFRRFKDDFKAKPHGLKMNYRSAPELVRIQTFLIKSLEPDCIPPESVTDGSKGKGECRVLNFSNHELEAAYIADLVKNIITEDGVAPRDICILTRKQPAAYSSFVGTELRNLGVSARVEDEFQDLLAEPAIEAVLHFLKLIVHKKAPESWEYTMNLLARATGNSPDDEAFLRDGEKKVLGFCASARVDLAVMDKEELLKKLASRCIVFFGARPFKAMFPQYAQGTYLKDIVLKFVAKLFQAWENTNDWKDALHDFEGKDSVPIMTVHKSKGLEYHTVIFIGLEDAALWGFKNSQNEETCGFFVALSRAKSRAIFTFCNMRPTGWNGRVVSQSRELINPLYQTLIDAGIEEEAIESI